jgi:hypothetical protein
MRDRGRAAEEQFEDVEQNARADRWRKVGEPAEQLCPLLRAEGAAGPRAEPALDVGPGAAGGVGMALPVPVVAVVAVEDRLVAVVVLGPPSPRSTCDFRTPTTSPRTGSTTGPPETPGGSTSPPSRICSSSDQLLPRVPWTVQVPFSRRSSPPTTDQPE